MRTFPEPTETMLPKDAATRKGKVDRPLTAISITLNRGLDAKGMAHPGRFSISTGSMASAGTNPNTRE